MNRVRFPCTFHGREAEGVLTLENDHTFACVFLLDGGRVAWPFRGHWRWEKDDTLHLVTPHRYAWVCLHLDPKDNALVGVDQGGGFVDFNIRGRRSTPLPLPKELR